MKESGNNSINIDHESLKNMIFCNYNTVKEFKDVQFTQETLQHEKCFMPVYIQDRGCPTRSGIQSELVEFDAESVKIRILNQFTLKCQIFTIYMTLFAKTIMYIFIQAILSTHLIFLP